MEKQNEQRQQKLELTVEEWQKLSWFFKGLTIDTKVPNKLNAWVLKRGKKHPVKVLYLYD